MLNGFVMMVSLGKHSYETIYEFRNGHMDENGLTAEYRFPKGINPEQWQGVGYFPLNNGKATWVISEIRFDLVG